MEKIKSPELIKILSSNRSRLNTMVHLAAKKFSQVNPRIVRSMVLSTLEPLFLKAKDHVSQFTDNTDFSLENWTVEVFELMLDSIGYGYLGDKGQIDQIKIAFLNLFTGYLFLAFPHPQSLWTTLLHGIHNFKRRVKNKLSQFSETLYKAAKYISSLNELQKFGFVLVWSLGTAAYRSTALTYLNAFSSELLSLVFGGSTESWNQERQAIIEELCKSPWFLPFFNKGTPKVIFYKTGGFVGDGGFFTSPPSVYYSSLGFITHDARQFYRIYCDAFGVQMIPLDEEPEKVKSSIQPLYNSEDHPEVFSANNFFQRSPSFLLEPKTWVCNKEAFVFTIPDSHYLFIIAKTKSLKAKYDS